MLLLCLRCGKIVILNNNDDDLLQTHGPYRRHSKQCMSTKNG